MENLRFFRLDKSNAAPFAPYLLPQVCEQIGNNIGMLTLGAVAANYAVGAIAALPPEKGVLPLQSIFVDPALRRYGVGTDLLRELCRICREETGETVRSVRTEYTMEKDACEELSAFLEAAGFSTKRVGGRTYCVDSADVHEKAILGEAFSYSFRPDPHIRTFSQLTAEQLREIEENKEAPDFLKPAAAKGKIMGRASTVWLEDGHPIGWVLFRPSIDGELILSAAYKNDDAPVECFLAMLKAAVNRWYLMLGRDCRIYITAINERVESLIENLTGGELREFEHYTATTGRKTPAWMQV